ncbi:MAG: hypothetical protein HOW73_43200 [Polyangiaceae bacterium]|nr:hypothetical protein [Polyangiaceae bacterium]
MSSALERTQIALVKARAAAKRGKERVSSYAGIPLRIDRPRGFVQKGVADDGTAWTRTYRWDYGYIDGTQGGDGEGLDVFIGPHPAQPLVHWVVQHKADGTFDEYKCMLGFTRAETAKMAYLQHVPKQFYGGMTCTTTAMLKAALGIDPGETTPHLLAKDLVQQCLVARILGNLPPLVEVPLEENQSVIVITKTDDEKRLLYGVVLEPDTVDAQDDTYDAETVEQAAHVYLSHFRNVGLQHKQLINHWVQVVESFIAPIDFSMNDQLVKRGSWVMVVKVLNDDLWSRVKRKEITGFSIGGVASVEHLQPPDPRAAAERAFDRYFNSPARV